MAEAFADLSDSYELERLRRIAVIQARLQNFAFRCCCLPETSQRTAEAKANSHLPRVRRLSGSY